MESEQDGELCIQKEKYRAKRRRPRSFCIVIMEMKSADCHWHCSYGTMAKCRAAHDRRDKLRKLRLLAFGARGGRIRHVLAECASIGKRALWALVTALQGAF